MKKVNTVRQVKENNLAMIKAFIRSSDTVTKHSVSQATGLSIATSNTLLNDLVATGEILETGNEGSTIGRPAKAYRYNADFAHICCLFPSSVGDQLYMYYNVMDLLGETLDERQLSMDRIGFDSFDALVGSLLENDPKITTFSIGIPAYVDEDFIHTCTIRELNGVDLLGRLKEKYSCNFYLENNMNAIAYGIYEEKKETETKHDFSSLAVIAYFKEGGTGAGIILNGKIHSGETGFAGEVGILPENDGTIADLADGSEEEIIKSAVISVSCFAAILNPAICVFTGENMSTRLCDEVRMRCKRYIPEKHMPKIQFTANYNLYYTRGLFDLVLQEELY